MEGCVNINNPEFKILKNKSGLSDFLLSVYWRMSMDKYGEPPKLDEISAANSEPALKEFIKLRADGSTKLEHLQQVTGKETVEEMVVDINNDYRDLETSMLKLGDEVKVDIIHRPKPFRLTEITPAKTDDKVNTKVLCNELINKFQTLYGIKINPITTEMLLTEQWKGLIADASHTNGFIYNGEIYWNVDNLSIDTPLHEMMHVLIGTMRFDNPLRYAELIELALQIPTYDLYVLKYPNRTRNDINEEIFVTEFSKLVVGEESFLDFLDKSQLHSLLYNVNRILDTMLMGEVSTRTISPSNLMTMSLRDVASTLNSALLQHVDVGSLNETSIHRIMQNEKSDLMKEGRLEEYCL